MNRMSDFALFVFRLFKLEEINVHSYLFAIHLLYNKNQQALL